MKKLIMTLVTCFMVLAATIPTFASELDQDSNPSSQDVQITLSIAPTYIVSIPADTTIAFNETSTHMGSIQASHMQIEPDKNVVVSATTGKLENNKDKSKTIPYKLMSDTTAFSSIHLIDTIEKADLSIAIMENDWNKAFAGNYKGIITFMISYENRDA